MREIICLGNTMHETELALLELQMILKNNTIPFKRIKHRNELIICNSIKIIGISLEDKANFKYYVHKKAEAFNADAFLRIQDPEDQLKVILGR